MLLAVLKPVLAVALATALTGCFVSERVESFGGATMGSTYTVKFVADRKLPSADVLQRETESILAELDRQLSTYRADSDISRFNALPAGRCEPVSATIRELVSDAQRLSKETDGALDLTVEPLLDLWGFGPHGQGEHVPSAEEIAQARQRVGYRYLRIDGDHLCKTAPLQVDFNSIAAGYAVDRVAARLESLGVDNYLVEITGELRAKGRKPGGDPWRIAIEAPRDDTRTAQKVVSLDGYAISTSGDYRNYFEQGGKRYSHTIDPQTGAPITHRLAEVTVADRSGLRADGLSTALMVMGEKKGLAFAEQRDIPVFLVIRQEGNFVTKSSSAFDRLFDEGEIH